MTGFDKELQSVLNKLDLFRSSFNGKDYIKVLGQAAKPAEETLKAAAPVSKKPHIIKDDGGKTKKVRPGNLRKSIQVFTSKSKKARTVLVGPIVAKKSRVKSVPGIKRVSRRNRAFYWKFVYYGTARQKSNRFIDKAGSQASSGVKRELKKGIEEFATTKIKRIFK